MNQYTTIPLETDKRSNPSLLSPVIYPYVRLASNECGAAGERYALALLKKSGYEAEPFDGTPDIRAVNPNTGEVKYLEVKTAQVNCDGKYVFHLIQPGCDYRKSDILLLLPVLKSGYAVPFVIPTCAFSLRSNITISSHPENYNGMWSMYRQPILEISLEIQFPFFDDVESL